MSILFVVYVSNKRFSFKRLPFFLLFQSPTTIYLTDYPFLRFPFYRIPSWSNDQPFFFPLLQKCPEDPSSLARTSKISARSSGEWRERKSGGRRLSLCAQRARCRNTFSREKTWKTWKDDPGPFIATAMTESTRVTQLQGFAPRDVIEQATPFTTLLWPRSVLVSSLQNTIVHSTINHYLGTINNLANKYLVSRVSFPLLSLSAIKGHEPERVTDAEERKIGERKRLDG